MAPSRLGLGAAVTLTVMRHAQREAFLEAAVLALVSVLLLNLAAPLALLVLQLHADRPAEETLRAGGTEGDAEQGDKGAAALAPVVWDQAGLLPPGAPQRFSSWKSPGSL